MPLDAATNGPSNEEKLAFMREYQQQKRAVDEANGVLRSLVKRAKGIGINTKAAIRTIQLSRQDPDEVRADLREQLHMMALRNMPMTQQELFPEHLDTRIAPAAKAAEDAWTAEQSGYQAGKNSVPREDNPYEPGSEWHVIWDKWWFNGQAAIAREMGENHEAANPSRSRPARKADADEAPAATRKGAGSGRKAAGRGASRRAGAMEGAESGATLN